MRQQTRKISKQIKSSVPKLSKALKDDAPQNFILYFCIKDNVSINAIKTMVLFVKGKTEGLSDMELGKIDVIDKKKYKHKIVSIMMFCNAQEYITYKHFLESKIKKHIYGNIESTLSDVLQYANL